MGRLPRQAAGFTLIELMIVVAIIGFLASVALPEYQDYMVRARVSEGLVLAEEGQKAVREYYDRWGRLPANNAMAGMAGPEAYRGSVVASVSIDAGMVVVAFDAPAVVGTGGGLRRIYLRPAINRSYPTGPLRWVCDHASVPAGSDVTGTVGTDTVLPKYIASACR